MKTLQNYLLLSSLAVAAIATPALAQNAGSPPPAEAEDQDQDSDDSWGWRKHGGHGGGHGGEHASQHGGKHGGEHGGMHRGKHHMMMMIDANADGAVSADEASALADGMFMRHDQNGDDVLDQSEFTTPPHGRRGGGWFGWGKAEADAVLKVRQDKFAALDTNKDGKLSKDEFFAEAQSRMAAADTDKDGKVTPWEFRAMPRP
jgi:EF hand